MARRPPRLAVLIGVLVVLILVLIYRLSETTVPSATRAPVRDQGQPAAQAQAPAPPADVKLEALAAARPALAGEGRNPFSLRPKAPPRPAVDLAQSRVTTPPPQPPGPPPVPPPPPIPLKFIGVFDIAGKAGKVAVLSDGRFVYHGREGELIDGRYRVVRIGEESIEIEHADGRGRQTIRLSGS
jgi:hypothetical protein